MNDQRLEQQMWSWFVGCNQLRVVCEYSNVYQHNRLPTIRIYQLKHSAALPLELCDVHPRLYAQLTHYHEWGQI